MVPICPHQPQYQSQTIKLLIIWKGNDISAVNELFCYIADCYGPHTAQENEEEEKTKEEGREPLLTLDLDWHLAFKKFLKLSMSC